MQPFNRTLSGPVTHDSFVKSPLERAIFEMDEASVKILISSKVVTVSDFILIATAFSHLAHQVLDTHPELARSFDTNTFELLFQLHDESLLVKVLTLGPVHNCLLLALDNRWFQLAELLIDKGATLDCIALSVAVQKEAPQAIIDKLLLKGQCPIRQKGNTQSPLQVARARNDHALIEKLLEYTIHNALEKGDEVKVDALMQQKVTLLEEDYAAIWERYPKLAIKHYGSYPHFVRACPLGVLESWMKNPEQQQLAQLFVVCGAKMPEQDFVRCCKVYPEVMSKLIKASQDFARICSHISFEQLMNQKAPKPPLVAIAKKAPCSEHHLITALRNGYDEVAMKLLLRFKPSTLPDHYNMTALHYAASSNNLDLVKKMLLGSDESLLLIPNGDGKTPRDIALASSNQAIVNEFRLFDLWIAMDRDDRQKVEELLGQKLQLAGRHYALLCATYPDLAILHATVVLACTLSLTPFCNNARYIPLLRTFIELGVQLGVDHILMLIENDFIEIAELAITEELATSDNGKLLVAKAAARGQVGVVTRLIEFGASPIEAMLHASNLEVKMAIVALLTTSPREKLALRECANSASIVLTGDVANFYSFCTVYPCFMAQIIRWHPRLVASCTGNMFDGLLVQPNNDDLLICLLNRSVAIRPSHLTTALRCNRVNIAKEILKGDIDLDEPDAEGMTALHYAAALGDASLLDLILPRSNSALVKNASGKTARMLVVDNPAMWRRILQKELDRALKLKLHQEVICALLDEGAVPTSSQFDDLLVAGHVEASLKSLSKGVDVAYRSPGGGTYLHSAVLLDDEQIALRLLDLGVDPLHPNQNGVSALTLSKPDSAFKKRVIGHLSKEELQVLSSGTVLRDQKLSCELALLARKARRAKSIDEIESLFTRYPKSISTIIDFFFEVDEKHLLDGTISLISTVPAAAEPRNLNTLIERLKSVSCETDKEVVTRVAHYINNVQNRLDYFGSPDRKLPAFKEQYDAIENALFHLVKHLEDSEGKPGYEEKVKDIALAIAQASYECFPQYRATAISLYNKYIVDLAPTVENALLLELQQLRGVLVDGMIAEPYVNPHHDVHAVQYIKRVFGYQLQLADRLLFADQLRFEASGFKRLPSDREILVSFYDRYCPSALFDCIRSALLEDRFRSLFIDGAKRLLKERIPQKEQFKQKKKLLQEKRAEILRATAAEDRTRLIQELQVLSGETFVGKGQSPVAALREEHNDDINSWLFDKVTFTPNPVPIILMLISQGALKFRV